VFSIVTTILVALVLLFVTRGSQRSYFPMSLATVQKLNDGSLAYCADGDTIVVTVVDRHGDSHVHRLDHTGVPRDKALGILESKRLELQNR